MLLRCGNAAFVSDCASEKGTETEAEAPAFVALLGDFSYTDAAELGRDAGVPRPMTDAHIEAAVGLSSFEDTLSSKVCGKAKNSQVERGKKD